MSTSLADHMVRFHSNLRLLASLRRAETQVLHWELELSVETEVDLTDPEDPLSENEDDGYDDLVDGDQSENDDDADELDGDEMKSENDEDDDQEKDEDDDDDDDDSDDDIPLGRARRRNAVLSSSDDEDSEGACLNWTGRKRRNLST